VAHDIQASSNIRKIRWRKKWKEIHRLEKIAERDAKRVAKGLLPLREANVAKAKKHREKVAALKQKIANYWFAPEIDFEGAVKHRIAECP
jgi:hypothetical protein